MTSAIDTLCAVLRSGRDLVDKEACVKRLQHLLREEGCSDLVGMLIVHGLTWRDFGHRLQELLHSQNTKLRTRAAEADRLIGEAREQR